MARETNERVEACWAGQLAKSEQFRKMLGATHVKLIDRSLHGDPPDALFDVSHSGGESRTQWCEMSGAWRSPAGAKEVFAAVEGKCLPPRGPRDVMVEPDARTVDSVIRAIMKKLGKDSYRRLVSDHGSGHLHIFLSRDHFPLFDEKRILRDILACLPVEDLEDQDTFQSISFGYRDHVYRLWDDSDSPDPAP